MKYKLLFFLVVLVFLCIKSPAQNNKFVDSSSGTWSLVEQMPYGYLLFGSNSAGTATWAVTDSTGKFTQEKLYPNLILGDVKYLPGQGLLVGGNYLRTNSDTAFLMRLDSAGNILWTNLYSFPTYKYVMNITLSVSKYSPNYWLCGSGFINGDTVPAFLIKTNFLGVPIVSKGIYIGLATNASYNTPGPLIEGNDKSLYFTLTTSFFEGGGFSLFKTDSLLNYKWRNTYRDNHGPYSNGMLYLNNNLYILSNYSYNSSNPGAYPTINLSRWDTSGNITKSQNLMETFWGGYGKCLFHTKDNGFVFCGTTPRNRTVCAEGLVVKLDSSWNVQWSREYGNYRTSFYDNGLMGYIQPTRDNGYITAGPRIIKTDSIGNSGCYDTIITYTDSMIPLGAFSIDQEIDSLKIKYFSIAGIERTFLDSTLYHCYGIITGINDLPAQPYNSMLYPNPNNGKITIQLNEIHEKGFIEIYNYLGERVYFSECPSLDSPYLIDIHNQADGIYLYRVTDCNHKPLGSGKFIIK